MPDPALTPAQVKELRAMVTAIRKQLAGRDPAQMARASPGACGAYYLTHARVRDFLAAFAERDHDT